MRIHISSTQWGKTHNVYAIKDYQACKDDSSKDLYLEFIKNSANSEIRKATQVKNNWQEIWTDTSPKICGWQTHMWKDAQHK